MEVACKYFAVVKRAADPANDLARTIYDGRPFNSQCKRPPPVNIPDPVDVSRFMSTIPANKLCVYLADFRHFFHQFGLHEKIKRYFGLAIGESMFAWNTLPMGFSWAPFVAQGTAMALAADATRKYHVRDYTNDSGIPHYIETKKGSRIYLTYDNLAVIGSNKREVQELRDAIMLRMRGTVDTGDVQIADNSANVKVKEEFMCHGRSLRTNYKESDADKNNCCHLGVQYGIHKNELFVRVAPKTTKRWAHVFQQFDRSTATKRDVDCCCSVALGRGCAHGVNLPCRTALAVQPRHVWSTGTAQPAQRTASAIRPFSCRLNPFVCRCLPRPRGIQQHTNGFKVVCASLSYEGVSQV